MLTPQFFEDAQSASHGCNVTPSALHFRDSTATCSGQFSDEPSIVPSTPNLLPAGHSSGTEKSMRHQQSPLKVINKRSEMVIAELSEDPLEDFKRRREERRKTQLEFICKSSSLPNKSPDSQVRSEGESKRSDGEGQRSGQRLGKYCTVTVNSKSSLLKTMKPIGFLIPSSKFKNPKEAVKLWKNTVKASESNTRLHTDSPCKDDTKTDAVVPNGIMSFERNDEEKGIQNNVIYSKELLNGQNVTCIGDVDQKTENENDTIINNMKNRGQCMKSCEGQFAKSHVATAHNTRSHSNIGHSVKGHNSPKGEYTNSICKRNQTSKSENDSEQCLTDKEATEETTTKQVEKESMNGNIKARRFIVNGEICYLVPAKLIMNQMKKTIQSELSSTLVQRSANLSQSLNEKSSKPQAQLQCAAIFSKTRPVNAQNNGNDGRDKMKLCEVQEPRLRVKSLVHVSKQLHIQRGCFWVVDDPSASQRCESFISTQNPPQDQGGKVLGCQKRASKRFCPYYPSIRTVKHSCFGKSFLHVSRLLSSDEDSNCKGHVEGKSQRSSDVNTTAGEESQVSNELVCNKVSKDKGQRFRFVINTFSFGSFIFADGKSCKDMDEPRLWISMYQGKRRNTLDQIVPNFSHSKGKSSKSRKSEKGKTNWEEANDGDEELAPMWDKIKSLLGAPSDADKLSLIATACDVILGLEMRIKGVLRALGCKDSVAQMLLRGYRYADMNNDVTLNNKSTPKLSTRKFTSDFVVPRRCNSVKRPRRETPRSGPLKPSCSDRLTSPILAVGESNWTNEESQAIASAQRRSALPLSSQLSFSESLTDDSENVNEFDLLFENSPSRTDKRTKHNGSSTRKQNGGTFHAYVNEVLDEIFEDDFDTCGKASPKKSLDQSSLVDVSSPWFLQRSSPSDKSSHCGDTPQSFSVNSLECDLRDEAMCSPKWYLTVEQDMRHTNFGAYHGSLSMKVVKNNSRSGDVTSNEDAKEFRKKNKKRKQKTIKNKTCQRKKRKSKKNDFDSYIKDIIDKESNELHEDEDVIALKNLEEIAMQKEEDELLPPVNKKTVLAKDLIKSDMLASFLFPRPRFIPEDPFGIGAETVIEKTPDTASKEDDDASSTWQKNIEVTPPQPKRGFLEEPPKVCKNKGAKRRKDREIDGKGTRKRPRRRRDMMCLRKPSQREDSNGDEEEDDFVFVPDIQKNRSWENAHTQKCRPSLKKRRSKRSKDSRTAAATDKTVCTKSKTRITRTPLQRRQALTSVN